MYLILKKLDGIEQKLGERYSVDDMRYRSSSPPSKKLKTDDVELEISEKLLLTPITNFTLLDPIGESKIGHFQVSDIQGSDGSVLIAHGNEPIIAEEWRNYLDVIMQMKVKHVYKSSNPEYPSRHYYVKLKDNVKPLRSMLSSFGQTPFYKLLRDGLLVNFFVLAQTKPFFLHTNTKDGGNYLHGLAWNETLPLTVKLDMFKLLLPRFTERIPNPSLILAKTNFNDETCVDNLLKRHNKTSEELNAMFTTRHVEDMKRQISRLQDDIAEVKSKTLPDLLLAFSKGQLGSASFTGTHNFLPWF